MSEQREQQNVDGQADGDAQITDLPQAAASGADAESIRGGGTATTTTSTPSTTSGKASVSTFTISKSIDSASP